MNSKLPGILVTGASGFIGRNFVISGVNKYRLFCIARRSQKVIKLPVHPNIFWSQIDISEINNPEEIAKSINDAGGVDFVLHLAGYYDFNYTNNPGYEDINVKGTENILKLTKLLNIKRFIFASSLAACSFDDPDEVIDENKDTDAKHPYAISKHKGEELVKKFSESFATTIVRFAAVYSDWCEYPPLYCLIKTWLSGKIHSRLICGKGETAITYIHIHDLIIQICKIFKISDSLPQFSVYIASPNGSVSHKELFKTSVKYYHGNGTKPLMIPKTIAYPIVILRYYFFKLIGKEPFERPWMMKYIDKKLRVNATFTNKTLLWKTSYRYNILRRLLFLIDHIKNHPQEWETRNEAAMLKIVKRSNIIVYNIMIEQRDTIIDKFINYVLSIENKGLFANYQRMEPDLLKWYSILVYQLIAHTVKSKDRTFLRNYIQHICIYRFTDGFSPKEIINFCNVLIKIIRSKLIAAPEIKSIPDFMQVYDFLMLTLQIIIDEIEDIYESFKDKGTDAMTSIEKLPDIKNNEGIQQIVKQMEDIFFVGVNFSTQQD